jgi:hypothetical protein
MKCSNCKFEANSRAWIKGKFIVDIEDEWYALKVKWYDALACPKCGIVKLYISDMLKKACDKLMKDRKEKDNDATGKTT